MLLFFTTLVVGNGNLGEGFSGDDGSREREHVVKREMWGMRGAA